MIDADYVLKQKIQVVPKDDTQIDNFEVYDNGYLVATGNENNDFIVEISKNGTYKIHITEENGKTHDKNINISNVDYDPLVIDIKINGNNYTVLINDFGCGIDYDSITIVNNNDKIIPYSIEDNTLSFATDSQEYIITDSDILGNSRSTTVYNND